MLVYLITNRVNDKQYVGQTVRTLKQRWSSHIYASRHNAKYAISKAIRKYGKKSFTIKVLRVCKSRKELNQLETLLIKKFDTISPRDNLTTGGESPVPTEETKKKQSDAKLGMHLSPETEFKKGVRTSPKTEFKAGYSSSPDTEFKKGQPSWNKGKVMPRGIYNSWFGSKHSVASKNKMRRSKLGKPRAWQVPWHHGNGHAYSRKKCRCEACRDWKRSTR